MLRSCAPNGIPGDGCRPRASQASHSRHRGDSGGPGITIARNVEDAPLVCANESFQRLTGYTPDEILGHNCRFLQGPADRAEIRRLHEALGRHEDVSVIIRNYRRDGTPLWNKVSISPIREPGGGRFTHFIGTQIDVTDLIGPGGA
jgi:PAS domain S-box-containing protein